MRLHPHRLVRQVGDREHQAAGQRRSLPPDVEISAGWDACMASVARPAAQGRIKALFELGFHKPGEAEDRLGSYLGRLGR